MAKPAYGLQQRSPRDHDRPVVYVCMQQKSLTVYAQYLELNLLILSILRYLGRGLENTPPGALPTSRSKFGRGYSPKATTS